MNKCRSLLFFLPFSAASAAGRPEAQWPTFQWQHLTPAKGGGERAEGWRTGSPVRSMFFQNLRHVSDMSDVSRVVSGFFGTVDNLVEE